MTPMTPMTLERALEVALHACQACKKSEEWAKAFLDPYFPDLAPFEEAAAVLRAFMEELEAGEWVRGSIAPSRAMKEGK